MKKKSVILFCLIFIICGCSNYKKDSALNELNGKFPKAAKIIPVGSYGSSGPDIYVVVDSNYTTHTIKFVPNGYDEIVE